MREQDPEWADYEVEEHEAKIIVANTIFDSILQDTIDYFQASFNKKYKQ
jgi:Fe-S cluster assembly iron-binding protein IscA